MRLYSLLAFGFAAFAMATPAAQPVAEAAPVPAPVAAVAQVAAAERSIVLGDSVRIMSSDAAPVNLVSRQVKKAKKAKKAKKGAKKAAAAKKAKKARKL